MADIPSPIGQSFSHYRIIEKLGGGGLVSSTSEGSRLQHFVALKFLPQDAAGEPHSYAARDIEITAVIRFPAFASRKSDPAGPHYCANSTSRNSTIRPRPGRTPGAPLTQKYMLQRISFIRNDTG